MRMWLLTVALAIAMGAMDVAQAHTGSTAYLLARTEGPVLTLRADYALRDLDDAWGIDADDDGRLTWGEVERAAPALRAALLPQLGVMGDGQACPLQVQPAVQIADHADGPYAVFIFVARCAAVPEIWQIRNTAFFDWDANHRALLRWAVEDGGAAAIFRPDQKRIERRVEASGMASFLAYGREGLGHVWSGWDHMLFIAGLFLAAALRRTPKGWQPVTRLGPALLDATRLVTAFTIAHALTLCLTVLGVVALPTRWVESAVALSVLFAGLNNLIPMAGQRTLFVLAWLFGLVHGTAIAGALLELGLPTSGRLLPLLGFNLGVEAAQLLLVVLLVPIGFALRQWRGYVPVVLWPGSFAVALAGAVWFLNRALDLGWVLPI